jgi:nucleoside-diphosphate-sugar epimerase
MMALVTGATSMVGDYLLPLLVHSGIEVTAVSRTPQTDVEHIQWIVSDLNTGDGLKQLDSADVWIHLASISLLPDVLTAHANPLGIKRLIVFSSTSKFTKWSARGERDRGIARMLQEGEEAIRHICSDLDIAWTIFRPTMIYAPGRDKNITMIQRIIERFGFFPLPGNGCGKRQPVHAEDLAIASLQVLQSDRANNQAYNLGGSEELTYREMVERIFLQSGKKILFIRIPPTLLRWIITVARMLPRFKYLTPDMADRMAQDMVFSRTKAAMDFGYAPRPFLKTRPPGKNV